MLMSDLDQTVINLTRLLIWLAESLKIKSFQCIFYWLI